MSKEIFENHIFSIEECGKFTIYKLKHPEYSMMYKVEFIVGNNLTVVTGDYGNWVFCREFHPKTGEISSYNYLDEKLEINSVQKSTEFSTEETIKQLKHFVDNFTNNYGREMNEEEREWVDLLDSSVFDEIEYTNTAFREKPNSIDYDEVPFGTRRLRRLEIVYNALDVMCEKISII